MAHGLQKWPSKNRGPGARNRRREAMPPGGDLFTNTTLYPIHFQQIHAHSKTTSYTTHYHKQYPQHTKSHLLISPFNTNTMTRVLDHIQTSNRIPQSVRMYFFHTTTRVWLHIHHCLVPIMAIYGHVGVGVMWGA